MGEMLALLVGDIDIDQENLLGFDPPSRGTSDLATGRCEIVTSVARALRRPFRMLSDLGHR